MAVARLGYEIDSTGVVRAVGDLDAMSAAAGRADRAQNVLSTTSSKASNEMFTLSGAVSRAAASITSSQQSANIASASFTGLGADVAATARETELLNREMNALRARFNPLFAVSQRYEQELRDIAEAERLGAISAIEAAQARDRASQILQGTTTQVRSFGNAVGGGASQVANLGAQINDIGVQLAAGQSPFQLAIQQGTQINQVFAQLGGGTAAVRALGSAFVSMLSPLSLATIGIIALGTAAGQWVIEAVSSADEADRLTDSLDELSEATSNLDSISGTALNDIDSLTKKYGEQAVAVRALFRELVAVNQQQALNAAQATIIAAQDQFNELERSLRNFSERRRELLRAQDIDAETIAGVLPSEMRMLQAEVEAAAQAIADDFNLTTAQAFRIVDALNAVEQAAGPEEAAQAAAGLASAIASAADEGAQLSTEMANVATSAATAFAAVQEALETGLQASFAPGLNPTFRDGDPTPPPRRERSTRGRRSGGGKTEAQRHKEEQEKILEQLRERQSSETMLQLQAYARDQEALKFALNNQAITREEYRDRLEALRIENFGSQFEQDALQYELEQQALEVALDRRLLTEEQYQQRLRELREANSASGLSITQDFFGEAATLMQSGNAKLFKIGQAAAIANAIVSGHSAAVAAWEKGMQAGGPPLAAAYTALSVAKTASQIAAIRSASSSGGGGTGGSASPSGITAESNQQQQQQTRAIIQVQGLGRTRFSVDEINEIIQGIQDASDDGVIIEGVQLT